AGFRKARQHCSAALVELSGKLLAAAHLQVQEIRALAPEATERTPQQPVDITELPYPLAGIGPLPQVLLSAFNAAVYHATLANSIRRLLASPSTAHGRNVDSIRGLVIPWLEQLHAHWNLSRP